MWVYNEQQLLFHTIQRVLPTCLSTLSMEYHLWSFFRKCTRTLKNHRLPKIIRAHATGQPLRPVTLSFKMLAEWFPKRIETRWSRNILQLAVPTNRIFPSFHQVTIGVMTQTSGLRKRTLLWPTPIVLSATSVTVVLLTILPFFEFALLAVGKIYRTFFLGVPAVLCEKGGWR